MNGLQRLTRPAHLRSSLRLITCAFAISLGFGSLQAQAEAIHPFVPGSDTQVLEQLPTRNDPRARRFALLRQHQQQQPGDVSAAATLAQAYIDYGRGSGDARYLGRAEGVLAPWLQKTRPDPRVLLLHATLLQSRHQFPEARVVLEGMLRADPDNTPAWLTLSAVALVQGDMTSARGACAHVLDSGNSLVTAGCLGAWSTVNGHAESAEQVLTAVLPQAATSTPEIRAWGYGLLADAAKTLGQDARADAAFKQALGLTPGDTYLVADAADFLLDQGRARDAWELTRPYPQSDTAFLRQTLAEQTLHLAQADADVQAMQARFADLERRGDRRLFAREQARFELYGRHDPARALQIAQLDWQQQKAPEDIRILLEAAAAAHQPQAARPALDFIASTHLQDPVVQRLAAGFTASPHASVAMNERSAP